MAKVTDLKTLRTTLTNNRFFRISEMRVHGLAKHYASRLGMPYREALREAWRSYKELSYEHSTGQCVHALDVPTFLRREMGW